MQREIKFRGKRLDTGAWVYGDLVHTTNDTLILPINKGWDHYKVAPSTVGQYTGLKDKDGKEVYEGDVILLGDKARSKGPIVWYEEECGFKMEKMGTGSIYAIYPRNARYKYEVVGNIHDNPELIELK